MPVKATACMCPQVRPPLPRTSPWIGWAPEVGTAQRKGRMMNAEDGALQPEAEAEGDCRSPAAAQPSNSPMPHPGGRARSAAGGGRLLRVEWFCASASAHQPRRPAAHPRHHLLELAHLINRLRLGRTLAKDGEVARHTLPVGALRRGRQDGAAMNESEKQFSFTRVAPFASTSRRAKNQIPVSLNAPELYAAGVRPHDGR